MFNQEVIIAIPVSLLLLAGMGGIGGKILHLCGFVNKGNDALRLFPISIALGFSIFSYSGYLIALAAPVSKLLILAITITCILLGLSYWRFLFEELLTRSRQLIFVLKSPLILVLIILTSGTLFLAAMNWLTPPKEGDALGGYMFTARWLYTNGLNFIPYNPRYSLFPINTELVYALSFAFETDLIAKFLDGLLGICFLLAVYELARRCGISRLFSFVATVSLEVIPGFANNWSSGKIDIAASYIFFAGMTFLFWQNKQVSLRIIALSTFLLGTACSQKYSFWILIVPLPLIIFLAFKKTAKPQILKAVGLFSAVLLLCLIPHFIKNIAWSSNPVAPFAQSLFNGQIKILPHSSDATVFSLSDVLSLPIKLFFSGTRLGPFPLLFLIGLPLYFFVKKKPAPVNLVLLAGGLQLIIWIAVRRQDWLVDRFLLAQIALFLIPAAYGLDYFSSKYKIIKTVSVLFLIGYLSFSGIWVMRDRRTSLAFILGRESREQWQERTAPGRAYVPLHRLSENLGVNTKLMSVGYFYNLPAAAIPYVSTEAEYYDFINTPDDQKIRFLKLNKFKFYLHSDENNPIWTNELKILDSKPVPGLEWTIFEVDNPDL